MKFRVVAYTEATIASEFPFCFLSRDNWDDYGLKTTFKLHLHLSPDRKIEVGDVKILKRGQNPGSTPVPPDTFEELSAEFCSLGQAFSYYEVLFKLGPQIYRPLLAGLRDVTVDPMRLALFEGDRGFIVSLLRSGFARSALKDAPALFGLEGQHASTPGNLNFGFTTSVGGPRFLIRFDFAGDVRLPGRINALIGYNGTGKTRLLANLALVIARAGDENPADRDRNHGRIVEDDIRFGAVIAVSYSAFDTFEIPGRTRQERDRVEKEGDLFGYTYCGLRTFLPGQDQAETAPKGLKHIDQIGDEFALAVKKGTDKGRRELFIRAMTPLAHEPSFNRIGIEDFLSHRAADLRSVFDSLSTGHKIVVNIIAQLVAHTERRSLVLIDEPESHLHPPLLAALLKSIRIVLDDRDSFAVVATHSPVVLQETLRRHVRVLRRFGLNTTVANPDIETFGENIGIITREVFALDTSATDYHAILEGLSADLSLEQIEQLFTGGMSSQARAFILSKKRQVRR